MTDDANAATTATVGPTFPNFKAAYREVTAKNVVTNMHLSQKGRSINAGPGMFRKERYHRMPFYALRKCSHGVCNHSGDALETFERKPNAKDNNDNFWKPVLRSP